MKSQKLHKFYFEIYKRSAIIITALIVIALVVAVCCICAESKNETKTSSDFVTAIKYAEVNGETLFKTDDGRFYTFGAKFDEEIGHRFLIEFVAKAPEDRTDEDIIEMWTTPMVEYEINWVNP